MITYEKLRLIDSKAMHDEQEAREAKRRAADVEMLEGYISDAMLDGMDARDIAYIVIAELDRRARLRA